MNSFVILLSFIFIICVERSLTQFNKPWHDKYESNRCPKLYPKNFVNYGPVGKFNFNSLQICIKILLINKN